ncbi:MAG: C25 family cysteine peptidase [Candidatus Cloacimonetes bacterium]|nr:C25 family cysteine peptidase [Candidatus Cloacimonadota bacterium]
MKKTCLIISLFMLILGINAYQVDEDIVQTPLFEHQAVNQANIVQIELENKLLDWNLAKSADIENFTFSKTYALPYHNIELDIQSIVLESYNQNGERVQNRNISIDDFAVISNQFIFKEMRGFTINFNPVFVNNNEITIVKNAKLNIIGNNKAEEAEAVSEAFISLYEHLAANYHGSYLSNTPIKKPSMLIISHNVLETYLNTYIQWRKASGFDIHVINKETIGTNPTNTQIKQAIVNYYNDASNKPDYLLIVGDSNNSSYFKLPTFYVQAPDNPEVCATDLDYTLIEGDDYFPEMLVGRFCVDSVTEFQTIVSKTIKYERTPAQNTNNWQNKALVVAGNYASGNLIPTSPVDTSRWMYEKFKASGYTVVDTVFYQNESGSGSSPEYLTEQIINAINSGVQYITYRGWGSGNGWQFPIFYRNHVNATNNNGRTPIIYSIVCDNGDFDNSNYDPCFGEVWMAKGTATESDGAVGFVGPSYLYTSTALNNCISSGMLRSVLDEYARIFGTTVMRGKIELYNNFPNARANGENVPFYFRIYNMLSDPALSMWKLSPKNMTHNLPETIDESTNHIVINVPGIVHGYATCTKDNNNYTYAKITDGYALLPIDNTIEGNARVTITAKNYLPVVKSITVNQSNSVSLVSHTFDNDGLISGQSSVLSLTIKNFSNETISNANVQITAASDFTSFDESNIDLGNIAAGESKTVSTTVNVSSECPDQTVETFLLSFSPSNNTAKFSAIIGGLAFDITNAQVNNSSGIINPGNTETIKFTAKNISSINAQNLSVTINPMTNAVECDSSPISINDINAGNTAEISFELSVQENAYVGRIAQFYADFTTADGKSSRAYFAITIGNVDNTAPTGPDKYGYFAYDSNDTNYPQAPVYNWIELDDNTATTILLRDDESASINLPITFRYYGQDYDSMTICSNGWVSFIETWQNDFTNWNIPAALGPYAMLAPYWDDLKGLMTAPGTWDPVKVRYYHDQQNNRFIIDWKDTYNGFNNSSLEKFQIILYPKNNSDGDIVFQYHTIDNPASSNNYATVGIENHLQNDGVLYTYANIYPPTASTLTANLAIKFTTDAPDNYVASDEQIASPIALNLHQNYPNPFNPTTSIAFEIPKEGEVSLEIYNIKGQKVKTLVAHNLAPGNHKVTWNGTDEQNKQVSSGIYFYKLNFEQQQMMKKMILIK